MILKILFRARGEALKIPRRYNGILKSFLLEVFEECIATRSSEGKVYHFFTFSRIFGKFLKREENFLYFHPYFGVYFATPMDCELTPLRNRLIFEENLRLGDTDVDILSAERVFVKIPDDIIQLKTLSPVLVPEGVNLSEFLVENLRKKYHRYYGKPLEEEPEIKPLEVRVKPPTFKGKALQSLTGSFEILAHRGVLKFVFETGLGLKNINGFGMVLPKS